MSRFTEVSNFTLKAKEATKVHVVIERQFTASFYAILLIVLILLGVLYAYYLLPFVNNFR